MKNSEKGMKRILIFWVIGLNMLMEASVPVAKAGLSSVIGGVNAPASTLGSYTMTSFAEDLRSSYSLCSYVTSPAGENITFSIPLRKREVGVSWSTWSHDYKGDVYWTGGDEKFVILTMPEGTSAFYFYAQPQNAAVHTITATAYDKNDESERIIQNISGTGGASYYGFYNTGGSDISKISIYGDADFAIGEFGISMIPAPDAFLLCYIGLSAVLGLKRQNLL